METRLKAFFAAVLFFSLVACEPEEELRPGLFVSDQIGQMDMVSADGIDYQYEAYFDLSSNSMKAKNPRDAWDLAFSADPHNPNIYVNSAQFMRVAATGSLNFDSVYTANDFDFEFERVYRFYQRGWMSDALQDPKGQVFLIDRGQDLQGRKRGYYKLQIQAYSNGTYQLHFANLDGANMQVLNVETQADYNYQFLSLANPDSLLSLEPPKDEWDLHVCKYMERLWDGSDTLDYSVTGVLINSKSALAYRDTLLSADSTLSFGDIQASDIQHHQLKPKTEAIGHEWKYYDLDEGTYLVRNRWIYFVQDAEGTIYRLRFIGFYGAEGQKGNVSFEYLPLE